MVLCLAPNPVCCVPKTLHRRERLGLLCRADLGALVGQQRGFIFFFNASAGNATCAQGFLGSFRMPLFINTNVSSLYAQQAAQRASDRLDISYQRLSSGLRINSAKDDAAGIQVANNLTTQLNGLTQGNRNAQDAIAFAQTVEGALDEVTNMLQRIRTLAVQSANGTMTDADRQGIQAEVDALTEEITRIAEETTFAGADMLNGNASVVRPPQWMWMA